MKEISPRLTTVLWRGVRRRCPACGQGALYQRWIVMHDHCSHCGLKYLRDQGDLWGYILVLDRAAFILPLIAMLYLRLYNPHSAWFIVFAVGLVILMIYSTPHRNGICLAVDYFIRRRWGDLAETTPTDGAKPDQPA